MEPFSNKRLNMNLIINGKKEKFATASLVEILNTRGYQGDYFAVAVNRRCVPRSQYAATLVQEGDDLEILTPMQGG